MNLINLRIAKIHNFKNYKRKNNLMKKLMTEWRNFVKVQKVNEKVYKQYASRLSEELQEVFWNLSEDQKVFVVEDWISQGRPADHLMEDKSLVGKIVKLPRGLFPANKGKVLSFDGESYEIEVTDKRDRTSVITVGRTAIKEEKMADLDAEQAYSTKVRGVNVIINLKDTDLEATRHSKERQFRHDEKISNRAIIQAVELAIGKIIQDYANGELGNDEPFHIRMVGRGKVPALNVIAVLDMRKGPDTIKVITVMRKDDFRTDNFGGGEQKTYTVQSRWS